MAYTELEFISEGFIGKVRQNHYNVLNRTVWIKRKQFIHILCERCSIRITHICYWT